MKKKKMLVSYKNIVLHIIIISSRLVWEIKVSVKWTITNHEMFSIATADERITKYNNLASPIVDTEA